MHRFYLPANACQGPVLTLTEQEAHHALHVLRVRTGERVVVLDGEGHEYLCEVTATDRHSVSLGLRQQTALPALGYEMTLLQAVTKGRSMEFIVQKATELGARRLAPILSERTVPQVGEEDLSRKQEKWEALAIEAIKQCGSPWRPRIEPPLSIQAFLDRGEKFDLVLLGSLQPGSRHPRTYFESYANEHGHSPRSVAVWIGPEGDFTPAELNLIKASGALPITLGPLVLRSETAAIYCLAVVSYELQR